MSAETSTSEKFSPVKKSERINSINVIRVITLPGILLMSINGMGLLFSYGELQRFQLYYIVFSIWIFQFIASPFYLKYFIYDPAEWIWRSLTYQKFQPLRIKS